MNQKKQKIYYVRKKISETEKELNINYLDPDIQHINRIQKIENYLDKWGCYRLYDIFEDEIKRLKEMIKNLHTLRKARFNVESDKFSVYKIYKKSDYVP